MKTFLQTVAQDIISKYGTDLSRIAVVFPNKRASLFMNEALAHLSEKPIWSPAYITISDLFRRHSDLKPADDIKLVCDLHKVFVDVTGICEESLDKFYGWGQLLLTDFDDIDKNMADADKVFANLKDIHALDDVSYLTEEQKEILKRFFRNFSDEHNSRLKEKFLSLWQHFGDIYHRYNECLTSQGLAYEGALYRRVACNENIIFEYETYIFVGFNMMQKVELRLLDRLDKMGKARFYWDFDMYYMDKLKRNEASVYIKQMLQHYTNELDNSNKEIYDNLSKQKDITFISAATENIQARYISDWLKENGRIEAGARTAIVMSDENLLQTVIHSLPPEVNNVNVTTGYPLSQSPFASLVAQLIQMQTIGHPTGTDRYRLHYVNLVLNHPYAAFISENYQTLIDDLRNNKRFYPTRKSMSLDNDLALLFKDIEKTDENKQTKGITYNQNLELCKWLLNILKTIGIRSNGNNGDPLFEESLFRMYTLINRLHDLIASGDLEVNIITLQRLMSQLIQATSIPFHGEPAVGIQIMGVLETRNLDFDHVLLLSCNEGNLPKGVNDASFIPYSIRKAYNLTTIDNKVAIYAYYFHSLLQRASDVTITYNSSTEDGKTGEMSRFMIQMLVESSHKIKMESLKAGQIPIQHSYQKIDKDKKICSILDHMDIISPTAINNYIRCQIRFYYRYVAGIIEPDNNDEDNIDNRIFGNIFHNAAEKIYLSMASSDILGKNDKGDVYLTHPLTIQKEILEKIAKDTHKLERIVDETFREELFRVHEGNFTPEYNGLQLINRSVILDYLKDLLKADILEAPFSIIGLEKKVSKNIRINNKELTIGGYIDRLDTVGTCEKRRIRVIDYKTGGKPSEKVKNIEDVFNSNSISKKHTDYYLQTILYSLIVSDNDILNKDNLPVSPALLFIQHITKDHFDPTLEIGGKKIIDAKEYLPDFKKNLYDVLSDIFNKDIPFTPTNDRQRCTSCPYKKLCE